MLVCRQLLDQMRAILTHFIGDSRCILSNTKCTDMIQLSMDHKPDVDFEKQRILSAGGTVFRGRVCGGVAVSRSFGDFWFKRNAAMKPHQQLVTAEPCIRLHRRSADDEFLFLACDGIYDVMTNEQIRKFIQKKARQGTKSSAQDICEELINECLVKGSRDNMSVILVLFNDRGGLRSGGNNSFGVKSTIFRKKWKPHPRKCCQLARDLSAVVNVHCLHI